MIFFKTLRDILKIDKRKVENAWEKGRCDVGGDVFNLALFCPAEKCVVN